MYYNFRPKSWTRRYSWVLLGASLSPISPAYWRHSISSSSFSMGLQVALVLSSSSPKTRHSSRWSGSCSCTPVIAPSSSLNTWANGTESRRRSNRENLSTDPSLSGARSYESTWELRSLTPGTSNLLIPLQVRVKYFYCPSYFSYFLAAHKEPCQIRVSHGTQFFVIRIFHR